MSADSYSIVLQVFRQAITEGPSLSADLLAQIPVVKPTWGVTESEAELNAGKIKATWLGHACFFVELPTSAATEATSSTIVRGARIIFDPVFSDRCSPSQTIGPKRYTSA